MRYRIVDDWSLHYYSKIKFNNFPRKKSNLVKCHTLWEVCITNKTNLFIFASRYLPETNNYPNISNFDYLDRILIIGKSLAGCIWCLVRRIFAWWVLGENSTL